MEIVQAVTLGIMCFGLGYSLAFTIFKQSYKAWRKEVDDVNAYNKVLVADALDKAYKRGVYDLKEKLLTKYEQEEKTAFTLLIGILSNMNIKNLSLNPDGTLTIGVFENHDVAKLIGSATVRVMDDSILADIELNNGLSAQDYGFAYPALGGTVVDCHEEEGIMVIDKFIINELSLCSNPNVDPQIQNVQQQINVLDVSLN